MPKPDCQQPPRWRRCRGGLRGRGPTASSWKRRAAQRALEEGRPVIENLDQLATCDAFKHQVLGQIGDTIACFRRFDLWIGAVESAMEGTNIRTATIYPAAINTELLGTISDKSLAGQMEGLYDKFGISPNRIAEVVRFAIDVPEDTTINEFTVGPANQPW